MSLRTRLKRAVLAFLGASDADDVELALPGPSDVAVVETDTWLYIRTPTSGQVFELPLPVGTTYWAHPKGARLPSARVTFHCDPAGDEVWS